MQTSPSNHVFSRMWYMFYMVSSASQKPFSRWDLATTQRESHECPISTASMMCTSSRGTLQAGGCLHGSTTWQRDMKEHMLTMATPEGTVTQMEKHSEKLGISFTQNIHMLHLWVYLKQRASMRNKSQELHLIAHTSPPCWWLGRTLGGLSLTKKYSTGIFLYWKLCLSTWTNMSSEASALIFSEFI